MTHSFPTRRPTDLGMKARLLGNHRREQRGFENVEGKAQAKIARTLEQQAGEPAVAADMKLIGHMAGRQRHAIEVGDVPGGKDMPPRRSEEHPSELQSLMRISYAVFCLKKKNNKIASSRNTQNR